MIQREHEQHSDGGFDFEGESVLEESVYWYFTSNFRVSGDGNVIPVLHPHGIEGDGERVSFILLFY